MLTPRHIIACRFVQKTPEIKSFKKRDQEIKTHIIRRLQVLHRLGIRPQITIEGLLSASNVNAALSLLGAIFVNQVHKAATTLGSVVEPDGLVPCGIRWCAIHTDDFYHASPPNEGKDEIKTACLTTLR